MVLSSRFNINDCLNLHRGEENIGEYGEFLTLKKIIVTCKRFDGYYKILRNIYLQTKNGTTEVDTILIHETGIYVFESKNYSGWIFGNNKQKEWTQAVDRYTKNRFYNPIWQNEGHISALKRLFLEKTWSISHLLCSASDASWRMYPMIFPGALYCDTTIWKKLFFPISQVI